MSDVVMSPGALVPRTTTTGGLLHSLLDAGHSAEAESAMKSRRQQASSTGTLLSAKKLHRSFRKGRHVIPVLRGVDFSVREGEFVAIVGQSGSGKSTLLHLLGTLDQPDAGEIHFEGHRIDDLPAKARDVLRNRYFGMIFQFYHLLPELTTLENILAPRMISENAVRYWFHRRKHAEQAALLLETVGLGHRLKHKPKELSGGEMQRAAIARALIAGPRLLLADEPTGNLDRQTGKDILRLLRTLNTQQNLTIVMVTHDNAIASQADRTVRLVEGLVERVA
jgi:lipoprotein-releasing system ATP-binding protein